MAKKKKSSSSGKDVLRIDFRKEEEGGGGGIRIPENDYAAKIVGAKKIRSSEKDTPGILIKCKVTSGKQKGKVLPDRLWITPKSLWRIRSLLEAIGVTVPKSVVNVPLKKLLNKELGITVVDDDPYQGRIKSKIADFIDLETLNEDNDDEDDDDDEDVDDDDSDDDEEDEDSDDDDEDDSDDDDEDDEDELDELDLDDL
jgi:hypothetical protein